MSNAQKLNKNFLRAQLYRHVSCCLIMLVCASLAQPVLAQEDLILIDGDITFSDQTERQEYDLVFTNSNSEINVIDSDFTLAANNFRVLGLLPGPNPVPVVFNRRLEGELNVTDSTLTLEAPGDSVITLPATVNLNDSVIRAAGGLGLIGREDGIGGRGDEATLNGGGVIIGGFAASFDFRINESGFAAVLQPVDLGRGRSDFFGDVVSIINDVTIDGGTAGFFQGGESKILIVTALSGTGTLEASGVFRNVTTGGQLTLGLAGSNRELSVENLTVTAGGAVLLNQRATLGDVMLQGSIDAREGLVLGYAQGMEGPDVTSAQLSGVISGPVESIGGSQIVIPGDGEPIEIPRHTTTAIGDLTMGAFLIDRAVDLAGVLNVEDSTVTLLSGDEVRLRGATTLNGGRLVVATQGDNLERNGLRLFDDSTVSGNGVILGNILSNNASFEESGQLTISEDLNVGDNQALLMSGEQIRVSQGSLLDRTEISIAGGVIRSNRSIKLDAFAILRGHGLVDTAVTGEAGITLLSDPNIIVEGGDLSVGDATPTGFDFDGQIDVGANTLTIRDSDFAQLGFLTTLNQGQIIAENGIELDANDEIRGRGLIRGPIRGEGTLNGTASFDFSSLLPLTINPGDELTVITSERVSISDNDPQNLAFNGGELGSSAGFVIDDSVMSTGTSLLGSVIGNNFGVNLFASGNVTIGDASRSDGVKLSETGFNVLGAGQFEMTLLDSDGVEANQILINGGSIRSDSGFVAKGTDARASGSGVIYGELDPAFDLQPNTQLTQVDGVNVGEGVATVLSNNTTFLRNLNMSESGRLTAVPGAGGLVFVGDEEFAGTVDAATALADSATLTASGDLTLGDSSVIGGFTAGRNSLINVRDHKVTLLDRVQVSLDEVLISGGELASEFGFGAAFNGPDVTITGFGVIRGRIGTGVELNDSGRLMLDKILDVSDDQVLLLSETRPELLSDIQIAGGELFSPQGLRGTGSPTISGFGTVRTPGPISDISFVGTGSLPEISRDLNVGSDNVILLSDAAVQFNNADVTIAGGSLTATSGFAFFAIPSGTSNVSGHGTLAGAFLSRHTVTASGGELVIGDASSTDGVRVSNAMLNVGSESIKLLDANEAQIGDATLDGGELVAPNGFNVRTGAAISGVGIIRGALTMDGNALNPTSRLQFGPPSGATTTLDVGEDDVTLLSSLRILANLGSTIRLNGGTLNSAQVIRTDTGSTISGFGTINASVAVLGELHANRGRLTVGDLNSTRGFYQNGDVLVGDVRQVNPQPLPPIFVPVPAALTLRDADLAEIDGNVTLIDGSVLESTNGILLTGGATLDVKGLAPGMNSTPNADLITGEFGNVSIVGPFRNDGIVNGPNGSSDDAINFFGSVNGAGSYTGKVRFNGKFSPGASPAIVSLEDVAFGSDASLEIELAGLNAGSDHDQLQVNGDITIDGLLSILLLQDFKPAFGDIFEIINVTGELTGQFTGLSEGAKFASSNDPQQLFTISYVGGDGNDVVLRAVPEHSTIVLGLLSGLITLTRRQQSCCV